jgi:hypothetical protein
MTMLTVRARVTLGLAVYCKSVCFGTKLLEAHDQRFFIGHFSQFIKLLLDFASTAIPGFSLLEIHNQDFCSLLDMYLVKNGVSSAMRSVGVSV